MGDVPRGHSPTMVTGAANVRTKSDAIGSAAGGNLAVDAAAGAGSPTESDVTPRRLYDSHFPFVWRNLRRLGVPDSILEDAAQDVFLVVHRRWDSFDARWSSVETWLFGILMRVARNHRRSLRRRAWVVPSTGEIVEVVPSTQAGPAELVARREAVVLLDRLLDALDDDKRAIVVLVDVEQLSVPQAAEALDVNLNTAYWRLRTARTQLRKALVRIKAAETRSGAGGGNA
jgi:RNA polymerase sigma-70 factor, ECF subfamily